VEGPLPLLRCLRISLAPSAFADVVAGSLLGLAVSGAFDPRRFAFAALASLGAYHGGMALNDFADREEDARDRPDRPIPSGALRPKFVLHVGLALLLVSLAAALLAGPATFAVACGLALLVPAYDFGAKRSPLAGPLLLGACRALNLGLGVTSTVGAGGVEVVTLLAVGGYAIYVALVSALARLEVGFVPAGRAAALSRCSAFAALLPSLPLRSWIASVAVALLAACWIWRERSPAWTERRVREVVGRRLGATILLDAALSLAAGFPGAAAGLVGLYAVARALARRFPPT
jgi:4-hydroxybenzoate polyprenyltransferase